MKYCILVFAAIAAAATVSAAPGNDDVEQLVRLQSELVDAYIHRDVSTLDRILADDYMFTNDDGSVASKTQVIADFSRDGARAITSYVITDQKVRLYGNAAVMTYAYSSRETYQGRDGGGDFRITRVFARIAGRWRMVAGHECRIQPATH